MLKQQSNLVRNMAMAMLLCAVSCDTTIADDKPAETYTHLAYTRMQKTSTGSFTGQFVLHRILPSAEVTDPDSRRVIPIAKTVGGTIVGLHRGHMYVGGYSPDVSRVNIQTGKVVPTGIGQIDSMVVSPASGNIFHTGFHASRIGKYDFASNSASNIKQSAIVNGMAIPHSRVALSPSGKLLAAAVFVAPASGLDPLTQLTAGDKKCEIQIIDLEQNPPVAKRINQTFRSTLTMTGGGDHDYAPAICWKDEHTVLVVSPAPPKKEATPLVISPSGIGVSGIANGTPKLQLYEANVRRNTVSPICEIPFAPSLSMSRFTPDFWSRSDGELMLNSADAGDHRVDLVNRQVFPDRHLSPNYEFKGDLHKPSLWAGQTQLAAKVNTWDVSVSPDGQQVVWMVPNRPSQWGWTHAEKSFFLHSKKTGIISLGVGQYDGMKMFRAHPVLHRPVQWLTKTDLQPSK